MNSFGKRVKQLRLDKQMSQTDLINAFKLRKSESKINKSMISKWENDKESPSRFQDVATLAEIFGVTTDYLVGRSNNLYTNSTDIDLDVLESVQMPKNEIDQIEDDFIIMYEKLKKATPEDRKKAMQMLDILLKDNDIQL